MWKEEGGDRAESESKTFFLSNQSFYMGIYE
jgi:hypothetical protein